MTDSEFDRGPHLLGYIVGTTEHDTVMRLTLGDVEGSLHATRDEAEAELVQVWAEGYDDHEVFEVRAFRKVD